DEDVILEGHPFADEGMAGNLAVLAHPGILLDLDEGTDLRVVAYLTAVEVDELRQRDAWTQLYIGSDGEVVVHSAMARPRTFTGESQLTLICAIVLWGK